MMDRRTIAHLGRGSCPACGWTSPKPDLEARLVSSASLGRIPPTDRRPGDRRVRGRAVQRLQRGRGGRCRRGARRPERHRRPLARLLPGSLRPMRAVRDRRDIGLAVADEEPRLGRRTDPTARRGPAPRRRGHRRQRPDSGRPRHLLDLGLRLRATGRSGDSHRAERRARRGRRCAAAICGAGPVPPEPRPYQAIKAAIALSPSDRSIAVVATYTAMLDIREALLGSAVTRLEDART